MSTKHLLNLYKKFKFPAVILRLYLVYGPGQDANRVIPITILNAIKNKKFNCSDGLQFRDFVHIDDVTDAIIKTLRTDKVSGNIFNIGSGQPVQIKKIILKICKLVGSGRPQFGKIKLRKDEISSLYPDITRAKKILNWKPKINLNLGLLKTVNYYKKNG